MEKTLYVHVGTPKTGTTALQQFCALNSAVLEKNGYSYPLFPYKYPGRSMEHNGMFLTGQRFDKKGKRLEEEETRIFKEGMETVKELFSKYDAVVLSDEELWRTTFSRRRDFWKELNSYGKEIGFQVIIIVYLRSQDEYMNSLWNQRIKEGIYGTSVMTVDEWLEYAVDNYPLDYADMIEFLKTEVGQENVIVRKYDRKNFLGGSIFADFMNALNLELTNEYVFPEREANLSLSGNNIEIKRILNTLPGFNRKKNQLFREITLNNGDGSSSVYSNTMISYEKKKEFLAQFQESNRKVAKEIFGEDGDLFELKEDHNVAWEKENPYMIDDVIRLIGTTTIYLQEENKRLEEKIDWLHGELIAMRNPFTYYPKKLYRKIKRKMKK